jgi:crotonobetaine/carnitine-CoA ligase
MHAHSIPASELPLFSIPATQRTVPALLRLRAERMGDAPLFSDRNTHYTGQQTVQAAAASASRLSRAGIKRGDRVALLCTNRHEFLDMVLGCGWLGAIVVPINTASRGGAVAAHLVQ